MTMLEYLYAFTKSEVTVEDKKQVTLEFGQEATAEEIIPSLLEYFGRHNKQQAVRLVVGGEERGYLLRTDLYNLLPLGGTGGMGVSDRSFDASAGASLPGNPLVELIETRCPTAGCPRVLVVTEFDENDPPTCKTHGTAMELCK